MKRAQGLQISTIILAVLGLIVLVLLLAIVYQRTNLFTKELRNVSENTCAPQNEVRPVGTSCDAVYAQFKDVGADQVCCRKGTVS